LHDNPRTLQALFFAPTERPVAIQIFGGDEDEIDQAARQVEQLGADIVDVNLGCSAPKVIKRGAGAGLLKEPAKIGRIVARLTRAVAIPVTAKIRLGWDADSRNYMEIAHILQDSGAALVAVHGRLQSQNYDACANWDAIAHVKQALHIPVIGNGDVRTVADIERIKRHTSCDGVMIGRAAIGNPWIFQRRDLAQVSLEERFAMVYRHLDLMTTFYGADRAPLLFRKHALKYLRGLPNVAALRANVLARTHPQEIVDAIRGYVANCPK
jgi:nifR3 family TIM-barrel protein